MKMIISLTILFSFNLYSQSRSDQFVAKKMAFLAELKQLPKLSVETQNELQAVLGMFYGPEFIDCPNEPIPNILFFVGADRVVIKKVAAMLSKHFGKSLVEVNLVHRLLKNRLLKRVSNQISNALTKNPNSLVFFTEPPKTDEEIVSDFTADRVDGHVFGGTVDISRSNYIFSAAWRNQDQSLKSRAEIRKAMFQSLKKDPRFSYLVRRIWDDRVIYFD